MMSRHFASCSMLAILLLAACQSKPTVDTRANLIPLPQELSLAEGSFELTPTTAIQVDANDELKSIGEYLAGKLRPSTGLALPVTEKAADGNIVLHVDSTLHLGAEGYELQISKTNVKLVAAQPAGIFHGIQTIRQLLPAAAEQPSLQQGVTWSLPACTLRDFPNYEWRGFMMDVSRHFFGVEEIKHLIDEMAYYKMNVFHWHLSDDQGWRIEIKSWPKLTATGGQTQVGGGKGGFYTQAQYSEVVKYAAERYITVIPEIDMPGHTNAALASYPELNCSEQVIHLTPGNEMRRKVPGLYTGIEVGFSTLCTANEATYKFIDDVIGELAQLTPGPYLHIGGDESHATKKEDYLPFVARVQKIVASHNKKVVGWDEIANTTLLPNTLTQVWADAQNGKKAIAQGAKLIMSPARKMYLDMSYDSTTKLGLHWAAYIEVDSAYSWDPTTLEPGITRENIKGVECALWTETIQTHDDIDYMVFPRLPGYAEIGWSVTSTDKHHGARSWGEYKVRLGNHAPRFRARGIKFYESPRVSWQ